MALVKELGTIKCISGEDMTDLILAKIIKRKYWVERRQIVPYSTDFKEWQDYLKNKKLNNDILQSEMALHQMI